MGWGGESVVHFIVCHCAAARGNEVKFKQISGFHILLDWTDQRTDHTFCSNVACDFGNSS